MDYNVNIYKLCCFNKKKQPKGTEERSSTFCHLMCYTGTNYDISNYYTTYNY